MASALLLYHPRSVFCAADVPPSFARLLYAIDILTHLALGIANAQIMPSKLTQVRMRVARRRKRDGTAQHQGAAPKQAIDTHDPFQSSLSLTAGGGAKGGVPQVFLHYVAAGLLQPFLERGSTADRKGTLCIQDATVCVCGGVERRRDRGANTCTGPAAGVWRCCGSHACQTGLGMRLWCSGCGHGAAAARFSAGAGPTGSG